MQPIRHIQICLLIFAVCLLTGCGYFEQKDKKIEELQAALNAAGREAKNVAREVEKNERELKRQVEKLGQDLEKERENSRRLKEESERTRRELEKANQEWQEIQKQWELYREKYRADVRRKAVGEQHGTLTLSSGGTFANVTVKRVDAAYVHITHDRGVARLPFTDLGGEWMDRFDYEPAAAALLLVDERRQKAAAEEQKIRQDKINNRREIASLQQAEEERLQNKHDAASEKLSGKYTTLKSLLLVIIKRHHVPPHYYTVTDTNGSTRNVAYYDYSENSWVLAVPTFDATVGEARSIAKDIREYRQTHGL